MRPDVQEQKALYAAVWRWHFYAGVYVAPFLMLLAFTGLVMLAEEPLERRAVEVADGDLRGNAPAHG